jgi:hypothetical protein
MVSASKMTDVVCAHNFFLGEGDEADFASDYIACQLFQETSKKEASSSMGYMAELGLNVFQYKFHHILCLGSLAMQPPTLIFTSFIHTSNSH